MALGKFTDKFFNPTAAFSEGDWAAGLPVANLAQMERFVERPARCETPEDLTASQFKAVLERPRGINLVGLLFNNLSSSAKYRLTVAGASGTLDDPIYQSPWTRVWRRLYASSSLPWESPNWWTGQPESSDLDLFKRHLWIPLAESLIASAIRVELDDQANPAGFIDVGSCWITSTWSPKTNFDRGRTLGIDPRDLVDEGPSGRIFGQARDGRRRISTTWSMLDDTEAQRLFDAGARCGVTRPVLFIPDIDDQRSLYREAFPATFERPPAPTLTYPKSGRITATFKEILA